MRGHKNQEKPPDPPTTCTSIIYHTISTFNDPVQDPLENIAGKGENADNPAAFSPFPTKFSILSKTNFVSSVTLSCHLQMLSIWTSLKILRLVKSTEIILQLKFFI